MSTTELSLSPFTYSELPLEPGSRQLRLIRLFPAPSIDVPLRCELFISSLDDPQEYEAISYCWGDPTKVTPIIVGDKQTFLTTSLGLALCYIRLPTAERILWADAICINQEDLDEKGFQVAMMREIYVNSAQVDVWLGEEEDAKIALDFRDRYGEMSEDEVGLSLTTPHDEQKWRAVESLFRRPWWSRTWVIQEVVHQRPVLVHIGALQTSWEELVGD